MLELSAAAIASVFQSTHPQGVGPRASAISWRPQYFNPPTRKGWDAKGSTGSTTSTYFNPPTRKGWDPFHFAKIYAKIISIHPPARGGTAGSSPASGQQTYFNPPTRKGWDGGNAGHRYRQFQFQSTHPQGVGLLCRWHQQCPGGISIHPPARGGTCRNFTDCGKIDISIHPPARGGTGSSSCCTGSATDFNPPTRKGWD